jgi:demethylmenaquinone methyltransferase / 2-methoxy-6-polyprenyl-1,4-benzoquinol methylase
MMPSMVGGPPREPAKVRAMFDQIAERYDLANSLMTLGQDRLWRRRTARIAIDGQRGAVVLDCACGTGKLASVAVRSGALRAVGVDFSERMIAVARVRHPAIEFIVGDASQLPFEDRQFHAVTIGFGLRNLADPLAGLREMTRVARRGGRIAVLEAVRPTGRLRLLLELAATAGPRLTGAVFDRVSAYRYLSDTVRAYASAEELAEWLREVGLTGVRLEHLGFGTVALAVGTRPEG